MTQKRLYNASSHPLQPLAEGQVVRMQTPKGYKSLSVVKEVNKEPRSYTMQCNFLHTQGTNDTSFLLQSPLHQGSHMWTLTFKIPLHIHRTGFPLHHTRHTYTSHSLNPHLLTCQYTQYSHLQSLASNTPYRIR